jgi:xanthine dehydrogenase accessory factor
MTCAGAVDLLVEPVDVTTLADPVAVAADAVTDALRRGAPAVEAIALGVRPLRLVVLDDGRRIGTLGSEALDAALVARASALLDERTTGVITLPGDHGSMEIFVQVHAPLPALVVVGATDVAAALVQLAKPLGFDTTIIDGRDRWGNRERFPTVDKLLIGMPSELVATVPLAPSTALILLSHDFKYDLPVLEVALRTRVGYIGVLGSRRRANAVREFLSGIGASEEDMGRVRIPVGLDIGARAPAEIALSILAELIAVRAGRPQSGAA